VPPVEPLSREDAVAELVRRYFASHGPSTIADFTWWSSLTVADARNGLDAVGPELEKLVIDGEVYWSGSSVDGSDHGSPVVNLLQAFDEYVVGYQRTRSALDADGLSGGSAWNPNTFTNPVTVDGQVVGGWRRVSRGSGVAIETKLLRSLNRNETDALEKAVERYGDFLALPVALA
jgi:hypothetical protein